MPAKKLVPTIVGLDVVVEPQLPGAWIEVDDGVEGFTFDPDEALAVARSLRALVALAFGDGPVLIRPATSPPYTPFDLPELAGVTFNEPDEALELARALRETAHRAMTKRAASLAGLE